MKLLLQVAFALVLAAGCGKREPDARLSFRLPPLPDGETSHYLVSTPAGPIGSMVSVVSTDWHGDAPVYLLEQVSRTLAGSVNTVDSSVVIVRQADLRPAVSFRFISAGRSLATTAANYGESSVAVSAVTGSWEWSSDQDSSWSPGDDLRRLLPLGARSFDSDQLRFLGRALRPDAKRPTLIDVVAPMGPPPGGEVGTGEFLALGAETVTVPAGTFDCRKLGLKIGDTEFELWYEQAGSGRLVRSRAVGTGLLLELANAPE